MLGVHRAWRRSGVIGFLYQPSSGTHLCKWTLLEHLISFYPASPPTNQDLVFTSLCFQTQEYEQLHQQDICKPSEPKMTQPTSVNMTFDTSLVDVNPPPADSASVSFSTTESESTLDMQQTPKPSPFTVPSRPVTKSSVQHIPTQDAYNQWAAIYDTDGNMLQAIDDLELASLLPNFLASVSSSTGGDGEGDEISVLDLGCGTGRNTFKLLRHDWSKSGAQRVNVMGLDFSQAMLNIASEKLAPLVQQEKAGIILGLRLECCDCFPTASSTNASAGTSALPEAVKGSPAVVDAVISTLVLEHVPLTPFFATLAAVLRRGGTALVTNMHEDMGRVSQAGFVNEAGVKVRGSSFVYSVQETVDAATEAGFEVLRVVEREMQKADVEAGRVGGRGWKWVGVKVWYGVIVRKVV